MEGKKVVINNDCGASANVNNNVTIFEEGDSIPNKLGCSLIELIDKVKSIENLCTFKVEVKKEGDVNVFIHKN